MILPAAGGIPSDRDAARLGLTWHGLPTRPEYRAIDKPGAAGRLQTAGVLLETNGDDASLPWSVPISLPFTHRIAIEEVTLSSKARYPSRHGLVGRHVKAEEAVAVAPKKGLAAAALEALTPGGKKGAAFFDRMFADLPPLTALDDDLEALANAMKDPNPADTTLDNPNVPAGFTYLGQFIDHDISLDLSPLSAKVEDPTMLENFRKPGLDLDCLYGAGLGPHRFLYRQDDPKFLIGTASASPDAQGGNIPELPNDLERTRHGVAMIGDHRNDENLVVA